MRAVIFATGAIAAGLYLCVVAALFRDSYGAWLFALPIFLIASGAVAVFLHWPAVKHERETHLTEIERLRTQAYRFEQERKPQSERDPASVGAEAERQYRWHRFWAQGLKYAADNGDNFAFRGCFERILPDHSDWRYRFAGPLVQCKWLEPIQGSIKTKPMPGWTAVSMLAELTAGTPPPYPAGEPPQWKQTAAENTAKHGENTSTVFATDR